MTGVSAGLDGDRDMKTVETLRYPVSIEWWGADLMNAHAPEKGDVRVASPREFGGTHPNFWSPEELLVSAVGSCFAITLRSLAQHLSVPLHELVVEATGRMERAPEGGYRFEQIGLDVAVETDPACVEAVERAAEIAEQRCIVARTLAVPVRVRLVVRTRLEQATVAA